MPLAQSKMGDRAVLYHSLLIHHSVGKDTTVEALALHNRRPVFTTTSGDLDFTLSQVEEALLDTFPLAQVWDCILLLDEADLFPSWRDVEDSSGNALVYAQSNTWIHY